MKKIIIAPVFLILILFAFTKCDPIIGSVYKSANVTYTVTGSGSLSIAAIMYLDGSGTKISVVPASLPWTITFSAYTYPDPWIWAQNISTDYTHTLTASIATNDPYTSATGSTASSYGYNCIAQTGYSISFSYP